MKRHCTNCKNFGWWNCDYVCMSKMKIIEESYNGAFWHPIPLEGQDDFNADKCLNYEQGNENEIIFDIPYQDFTDELKRNGDLNISYDEYYEKYYKRTKKENKMNIS